MAWIESHQSLLNHRKTIRAAALLKADRYKLIGHLHALWWWALDNADLDGKLDAVTPEEVAIAAGWPENKAADFVAALEAAGFLDKGMVLHDWYDYAGKLNAKRAANKERMRSARAGHVQRTERDGAEHVQGLPTNQPPPTQPTNLTNTTYQPEAAAAYAAFQDVFGTLNPVSRESVDGAIEKYGPEWVCDAIKETADSNGKSFKYTLGILGRWEREGRGSTAPPANGLVPDADLMERRRQMHEAKAETA